MCGVCVLLTSCMSQPETIDVHLQKRAGVKSEYGAMMSFAERDTTKSVDNILPEIKMAPKGLVDVKYYYGYTDFPQALYQGYCQGLISKDLCMSYFNAWGSDTLDYSSEPLRVFVAAAIGLNSDNKKVIVFDGNANLDLSDDEMMQYDNQHPVPLYHERYINGEVVADTTYVYTADKRGLCLKTAESVSGKITLKGQEYDLHIDNARMQYDNDTELNFSTQYHSYTYRLGQYAVLSGSYFLIDSLSADGRYVHMTEDPDAEAKEVMQKGFRACSFVATDIDGDTIRFPEDFNGKYVLLDFWATTCGACVYDIKTTYLSLYEKYNSAGFEILGVADDSLNAINNFTKECPIPWITVADRENKSELIKRFNISSFPTVYLIGPEGRIVAEGFDVRMHLDAILARCLK